MRKIAAHYAFCNTHSFLKFPVLCFDNAGILVEIIKTVESLKELEGIEFYSGILFPGFKILDNKELRVILSDLSGLLELMYNTDRFTNDKENNQLKIGIKRFDVGSHCGLVLLENIDLQTMKITKDAMLRILI